MIELTLTGTVSVQQMHREEGRDGRAEYTVTNTIERDISVEATKEFPDGYVNLEGYVLSENWTTENDLLHAFDIPDNPALADWRVLEDSADLSVEMDGTPWDWVQQAVKYVTERPDQSVHDTVSKFESWDETDSDSLNRANTRTESVEHIDSPVGSLSDREWNLMLNELQNRVTRAGVRLDIIQFKNDGARG